jgi:hypothetical protein
MGDFRISSEAARARRSVLEDKRFKQREPVWEEKPFKHIHYTFSFN